MNKTCFTAILSLAVSAHTAPCAELHTETKLLHAFEGAIENETPVPVLSFAEVERVADSATEGGAAWRVRTKPAPYPSVYFKLAEAQDWSGYSGVAVDIANRGKDPLRIAIRVDDDPRADGGKHCRTGDAVIDPGKRGTYVMAFGADPKSLGMKALPGLDGMGMHTVGAVGSGDFNWAHIVAYQLFLVRPSAEHDFVIDNVRLLPGRAQNFNAIVDAFGQYTRQTWPGKIASEIDLRRARAMETMELARAPQLAGRTKFGGWADGPRLAATGVFRTAKHNGKWALVDPEGALFLSVGPTTVGAHDPTIITGRETMFAAPPADDATLAKHIRARKSADGTEGQVVDFYSANLERKHGADYRAAWQSLTLRRLRAWGCNTIGAFSSWSFNANNEVPYTFTLWPWGGHKMLGTIDDPFDPKFAQNVRSAIHSVPENVRHDPFLIGWFVGNEQHWGGRHTIPQNALSAHVAKSPAKAAFVDMLKNKYGDDIATFNAAWGVALSGWDALDAPFTPTYPLAETVSRDFSEFLSLFARQYFTVVKTAIADGSPHHLYLGCRFAGYPQEILDAAVELHDVLSFNIYQTVPAPDFMRHIDKPIVIGEFHFGATDRGMFSGGLLTVESQQARGDAYVKYLRAVWDNPNFVGAHWFQYTDQPLIGRPMDGENGNVGFVDITDTPYRELLDSVKAAHTEMYKYRFGK